MKYIDKKSKVIEYLKDKDFTSPTEIGYLFGGHSAVGSPICLKMTKEGILVRNKRGHYKLSS